MNFGEERPSRPTGTKYTYLTQPWDCCQPERCVYEWSHGKLPHEVPTGGVCTFRQTATKQDCSFVKSYWRTQATHRERERMQRLNEAMETLRATLPGSLVGENRLSKIETLKDILMTGSFVGATVQICSEIFQSSCHLFPNNDKLFGNLIEETMMNCLLLTVGMDYVLARPLQIIPMKIDSHAVL
ncbi:hypothetical protein P879_09497 [Paragonimus westermani]|uniref:BHLH domain-containing protein n=1 Tax=Paragonimus westermani TaxID=34504 RepID=A0A8T0D356_9TREM|nr:hypothetical protein P879_09497 [Paragonimus westermani]